MLAQNRTLRGHALGSFRGLLGAVTTDPAMQAFLSLADSDRAHPNENYARELLELFTLGAGNGYTERDVREAARALTGFRGHWSDGRPFRVSYDPSLHDPGVKVVFGHRGRFDWRDVLDLAVGHPRHAAFLVGKLWAFFVTEPLDHATRRRLTRTYVRSGHRIAPRRARDPRAPGALRRPRPPADGQGADRAGGRDAADDRARRRHRRLGLDLRPDGPDALPPAVGRGVGLGAGLDVDGTMAARFQAATWMTRTGPSRSARAGRAASWTAAEHVARARRATARRGRRAPPTPSCSGWRATSSPASAAAASRCRRARRPDPERPAPPAAGRARRPAPLRTTTTICLRRLPPWTEACAALSDPPLTRRQVLGLGPARGSRSTLPGDAARATCSGGQAPEAAAPEAPVLVAVFVPGRPDLLDRSRRCRLRRYADLRRELKVGGGARGGHVPRGPPRAGARGRRRRRRASTSAASRAAAGIDYANPDLSHFHSRHFWETGLITERARPAGWAAGSTGPAAPTARSRGSRWAPASRR